MTLAAGIHTLGSDAYHNDPCDTPSLSASLACILVNQSPAHAYAAHPKLNPNFVSEDDPKFDLGVASHALLLEGMAAVEIMDYPDWRTAASKEARALARSHGRIPMLRPQGEAMEAMVAAVRDRLGTFDVDPPMFVSGKPEQTVVWNEDGITCRARLDWLHDDMSAIDDFKSTTRSANPQAFSKTLYNFGYHIQARMYQRAIASVTGREPAFRFCVAETTPPFAMSIVALTPAGEDLADKQIASALEIWKRCLDTDTWPAYPTRVCYAEPPGWAESAWLEREALEEAA